MFSVTVPSHSGLADKNRMHYRDCGKQGSQRNQGRGVVGCGGREFPLWGVVGNSPAKSRGEALDASG